MENLKEVVENRINELLSESEMPELLRESMRYSLNAGGKRLRPLLNIYAHMLISDDYERTLDIACAIEMIHTYSLIHDDLPAMDNDDMRRGKPTNHKVFGEAQAILAGDGLLNFAYEVMIKNAIRFSSDCANQLNALMLVSKSAGVSGMIAGQVQDIYYENKNIPTTMLEYIHKHKTGDMIIGALMSGLAAAGGNDIQFAAIEKYGLSIGLAFQIIDDILDATSTNEEMGKTVGKDAKSGKNTYVSLYGLKKSYEIAEKCTKEAIESVKIFEDKADKLIQIAENMLKRKN